MSNSQVPTIFRSPRKQDVIQINPAHLSPKIPSKLSFISDSQQLSPYPRNVGPRTELRYKDKGKAKELKPVKLPKFLDAARCYGSFHDLQESGQQDSTDESTPLASLSKKR